MGLYDPHSPIRVRVLHAGKPVVIDHRWWHERFRDSIRLRNGLFSSETTGGRWINGESDRFPALVLDRYADTCVLKLYSAIWFPRFEEIVDLIRNELNPANLVLRLSRNITSEAQRSGFDNGHALIGSTPDHPIQFLETGLQFEADVVQGQKTGFFLDQRENRRAIEALAHGKNVLNAFSFSGGFSLYAARGGANTVTDVDISAHALASSERNFALNRAAVGSCEHRLIQADVFKWLKCHGTGKYDLVILDPPSLAKRQSDRAAALKAYSALAESGFALTAPGGITVCCSCSAHIRSDEFFTAVTHGAEKSGRKFSVMQQTREPIDHHATFAEAEYLKAIYLRF